ncbi:MAG: hypothetical protein CH6_0095 [Candidatus Kapaibacterium sp.]|nr:MAG: hypothetical protein CH6_0095 [Candidatus Kapabacteria bacterium]
MGAISKDKLAKEQIQFVNIDKDDGGFIVDGQTYPGFEGTFLGINTHEYEFKGKPQKKIDIYIEDGYVYCLEFGKYSWLAFKLLNQLLSVPPNELTAGNNHIRLIMKKKESNLNIFVRWNGAYLRWKYKFSDLKFNGKDGEEKIAHLKKIVDKWFNVLYELKPFDPKKDLIKDEEADDTVSVVDDEDLPF